MEQVKLEFPGIIGVIPYHIHTKYTKNTVNESDSIIPFNLKLFLKNTFTEQYTYAAFAAIHLSPLHIMYHILSLLGFDSNQSNIGHIIHLGNQYHENSILSVFLVEIKEIDIKYKSQNFKWQNSLSFIKNGKIKNENNTFNKIKPDIITEHTPITIEKILNALEKNDLLFV